jgi:hypothetical protein
LNHLVHEGLSESGLVEFIVAVLTVADQVDDDITLELLSEFRSEFESALDVFHAVGVDVEDGSVDRFSDVGRVDAGSALAGVSCESDLVVYHHVNGATDAVVVQRLHLQLLVNNALACHRGITVNDNRHDLFP